MRNQYDRCWRTEWVNRGHCWAVGWGEETAAITRAGGTKWRSWGSSQLEAQGAGAQTLEERALLCWCWHLSASAMRLLLGVWSETGDWNSLLPTGTRRSKSPAQPCRCPLAAPPPSTGVTGIWMSQEKSICRVPAPPRITKPSLSRWMCSWEARG